MYCLSIGPFYEITCSFSSTFMCPNDSSRNHLWTFSLFLWFYVRKWLSWELSLDFSCFFFAFTSKNDAFEDALWTIPALPLFLCPKIAHCALSFGLYCIFFFLESKINLSRDVLWTFSSFFYPKSAPYSCNSRGRPSGSWKKVNFLLENSSIRTGSQGMSMTSSSAFTCSTESTRNAR